MYLHWRSPHETKGKSPHQNWVLAMYRFSDRRRLLCAIYGLCTTLQIACADSQIAPHNVQFVQIPRLHATCIQTLFIYYLFICLLTIFSKSHVCKHAGVRICCVMCRTTSLQPWSWLAGVSLCTGGWFWILYLGGDSVDSIYHPFPIIYSLFSFRISVGFSCGYLIQYL